jgi:hypothetical protein
MSAGFIHGILREVDKLEMIQTLDSPEDQELLSKSMSSDQSLVSYTYSNTKVTHNFLTESPEMAANSAFLVKSRDILNVETEEVDTVEMVAVIPKRPLHLDPSY